ncbi:hypothetical protein ABPG73_004103 [Tetrahymena malaccensis]
MWGNSYNNNSSSNGYQNNKSNGYSSSNNNGNSYGSGGKWNDNGVGQNLAAIDWTKENLTTFQKVFYKESQKIRSEEEIEEFYRQNHISAKSPHGKVPDPFLSWTDTHFPQYIMNEVTHAKFDKPSPIQSLAFPVVLSGHDLIGIAETGSGKTLSFLLPSIVHINAQPTVKKGDGPIVLVLAPTRELAMQIERESERFGKSSKLKCACIYGGADKYSQRALLQQGVDVVIATPGRLIDFLESETTTLRRVTYLVLDEADRMLDMGFEIQIRKILGQIRPDRQTLMFSATWPKNVQNLAQDYCKNTPVYVQIGKHELAINERIKQIVYVTDQSKKINQLIKQLDCLTQKDKVLIFAQTKKGCESMSRILNKEGFKCLAIHGDKAQKDRDYVMNKFKSGECRILIATDVASRGLDVKDVSHVFNYDFPKVMEDYVHRIGRTGRAGAYGCAVSFLTFEDDKKISREYVQMLHDAKQEIPIDLLDLASINPRYRSQYKTVSSSYYDIKKFNSVDGSKPSENQNDSNNSNGNDKYSNGNSYNSYKSKKDDDDKRSRSRSPYKSDNSNRWDKYNRTKSPEYRSSNGSSHYNNVNKYSSNSNNNSSSYSKHQSSTSSSSYGQNNQTSNLMNKPSSKFSAPTNGTYTNGFSSVQQNSQIQNPFMPINPLPQPFMYQIPGFNGFPNQGFNNFYTGMAPPPPLPTGAPSQQQNGFTQNPTSS